MTTRERLLMEWYGADLRMQRLRRLVDRAQKRIIRRIINGPKVNLPLVREARATRDRIEQAHLDQYKLAMERFTRLQDVSLPSTMSAKGITQ